MIELIAKKFIPISEIIEMGIEIPEGTKLYNKDEVYSGQYLMHVKQNNLDYHVKGFESEGMTHPFPPNIYGIIIERPFPQEAISDAIALNK